MGESLRQAGEDIAHVRMLAYSERDLPPIMVQWSTMRVVDGMHRLRAVVHRGDDTIAVRFVDGTDEEMFVLAVYENVKAGLPLSFADRERAAERILSSHLDLSDRGIGVITGLSASTVRAIRRHSVRRLGRGVSLGTEIDRADCQEFVAVVPVCWRSAVAELAHRRADQWRRFAHDVERPRNVR